MINLFEVFNKKAIVLYKSFKFSGINRKTIVIEEEGFLPDDITTPYKFFSNNPNIDSKPLFFNEIEIPRFWKIEGNNNMAFIKNLDEVKARIIYKPNYKYRIVERVEWLDKRGHTQFIDYYNNIGKRYAQVVLDVATQKRILKRFFNYHNEVFLTENFATNDIILNWKNKEYFFHSKIQFVNFYLKAAKLEKESFMINSLLISPTIVNDLSESSDARIFWQDEVTADIVRHMENALSKESKNYKIIVPSKDRYQKVLALIDEKYHDRILIGGYVYNFVKKNKYTNKVLTLTNSDQLPNIETIIGAHPNAEFHIAAVTEMSMNLLKLNKYPNVNLYPNAKMQKMVSLYEQCDIYLDINKGNEILDAVRAAFDYNLLILGYYTTAHNRDVVPDSNLFEETQYQRLSNTLGHIMGEDSVREACINSQQQQAGAISKEEFIKSMNS
ncbi:accessory Sec system glycosylation chaperone GtfB [Staphylococcus caeli]|uniref:accessory Sec system glycosylation chaperone GtfB n=1 Tax=Staphylococcus caeli TaxID=2201815 RepID=UPI003F5452A9